MWSVEDAVAARKAAEEAGDMEAWARARAAEVYLREGFDEGKHPRDRKGRFMFHVSDKRNRESIGRRGLVGSQPDLVGQKPGVYLYGSLAAAKADYKDYAGAAEDADVYRVDVADLNVKPDPAYSAGAAYVGPGRIEAKRLKRVGVLAKLTESELHEAFSMGWKETLHPRTRGGEFARKLGPSMPSPTLPSQGGRSISRLSHNRKPVGPAPMRRETVSRAAHAKATSAAHSASTTAHKAGTAAHGAAHKATATAHKEEQSASAHITHYRNEKDIRKHLRKLKPGDSFTTPSGVVVTRAHNTGPLREYDVFDDGATSRGKRRVVGLRPAAVEAFERHSQATKGMADPGTVTKGEAAHRYEPQFKPKAALRKEAKERYRLATEPVAKDKEKFDRYYPDGLIADAGWGGAFEQLAKAGEHTPGPVRAVLSAPSHGLGKVEHFLGAPDFHDAAGHAAGASHGKVGLHAPDAVHQAIEQAPNIRPGHGASDVLHGMADPGIAGAKMTATQLLDQAHGGAFKGAGNALHQASIVATQLASDETVRSAGRIAGHVIKHLVMSRYDEARAARLKAEVDGDGEAWQRARYIEEACKARLAEIDEADSKADCPDCGAGYAKKHKASCKRKLGEGFEARLHPRGRSGQFIDALNGIGPKSNTYNVGAEIDKMPQGSSATTTDGFVIERIQTNLPGMSRTGGGEHVSHFSVSDPGSSRSLSFDRGQEVADHIQAKRGGAAATTGNDHVVTASELLGNKTFASKPYVRPTASGEQWRSKVGAAAAARFRGA